MIASSVVEEVKRLLSEGRLSQRQIAQQLGVSRGTVNAIAQGKRPEPRRRQRNPDQGFETPAGPLTRCPGCGGLVLMPCLLCRVRAMQERERWEKTQPRQAARPHRNCRVPCTSPVDRSARKEASDAARVHASPRRSTG